MLGTYARAQWWVRARSWVGDRLERTDPLEASEAGCDGWWAAVGGEAAAGAVGGHPRTERRCTGIAMASSSVVEGGVSHGALALRPELWRLRVADDERFKSTRVREQ